MARDAAGAEWGNYFRCKGMRKASSVLRRRKLPSIYLMYRSVPGLQWFGEIQIEVKVGRTGRSPQLRLDALHSDGFNLFAYWPCELDVLKDTETRILANMRNIYGPPSKGREFFYVGNVKSAYRLIAQGAGA